MFNKALKLNTLIMANFFFGKCIIYRSECFPWIIISLNPYDNPAKWILLLSLLNR